jgi:hypothetical protein
MATGRGEGSATRTGEELERAPVAKGGAEKGVGRAGKKAAFCESRIADPPTLAEQVGSKTRGLRASKPRPQGGPQGGPARAPYFALVCMW